MQCLVTSGDFPMTFSWLFKGQPIEKLLKVSILQVGKRSSALNIDYVEAFHAGDYTCLVKNLAGQVNYTAQLTVNG